MGKRLFRSIRTRTTVAMAVMFLFMLVVVTLILNTLMLGSINKLEEQYISEHVTRAVNAVDFELNDLKKIAVDWAVWTDTYQFVSDHNRAYIDNNLDASTIANLRLDVMAFIDKSGHFVYAGELNGDTGDLEPPSKEEQDQLSALVGAKQGSVQGLLRMPGGMMMVAMSPILTSEGMGPARGTLVIGRYLDESETTYLSNVTNQAIMFTDPANQKADPQTVLSGVRGRPAISVRELTSQTIHGATTIDDVYGNPAVVASINMSRDMSMIGRSGIQSVVIALFASCLLFTVLILFFMHRVVLSRILSMSGAVKAIGEHDDPAERLKPDEYCDELATMTGEINGMLDKIQESRRQIEDREDELRTIAEELKQEVAERRKAQEEITHLAYHDHLTGLPNRLHFTEQLNHGIQLNRRMGKMLAILFLDLDGFKMINDTMGHQAGDLLLVEVSKRLAETLRESDSIARLGGDEFVVMVENIGDINAVDTVAARILDSFHEPFVLNNQECFITTSIGVAVCPPDGEEGETLIKNADIAMYRAKEKGKNQYVMCSEGIKNKVLETMKISNRLFRALERREFEVYYQPQINCGTNLIVGAEALIRWNHPEMGMVLPGEFISIAEQTGLILTIGEWVLRTACAQNKAWQDAGYPRIRIGVNLSIRQFQNHNIVSEVRSILADTGLDSGSLELEITESIAMREKDYVIESLNELRELGIHISIDDFGIEYSSMSHLKQLPVDRIKIPMPFVQGIDVSSKDEAITKSIIVLAKSLGLGVIAEGVETKSQHEFLTQRMCDEIQGFYHFKPMCAADFESLLLRQQHMGITIVEES